MQDINPLVPPSPSLSLTLSLPLRLLPPTLSISIPPPPLTATTRLYHLDNPCLFAHIVPLMTLDITTDFTVSLANCDLETETRGSRLARLHCKQARVIARRRERERARGRHHHFGISCLRPAAFPSAEAEAEAEVTHFVIPIDSLFN